MAIIENLIVALISGFAGGILSQRYRVYLDQNDEIRSKLKPVYNEICSVADGDFERSGRHWRQVLPADRLWVNRNIRTSLDSYTDKRGQMSVKYGRLFAHNGVFDEELGDLFYRAPKNDEAARIHVSNNTDILIDKLFRNKGCQLSQASDRSELRDQIIQFAQSEQADLYVDSIDQIDVSNWNRFPWHTFYDILHSDDVTEWLELRDEVQEIATTLKPKLKRKVTSRITRIRSRIPQR